VGAVGSGRAPTHEPCAEGAAAAVLLPSAAHGPGRCDETDGRHSDAQLTQRSPSAHPLWLIA
jgi:hypothetical protein